jgi:hypothetical protein
LSDFKPFPKIPRWKGSQHCFITEKIDGTNAQIVINEDCTDFEVASRNRWITPDADNYGFAQWCQENKTALLTLGKGTHFGEWWGLGIGRGYGITEKRLSLFNTLRWGTPEQTERLNQIPRVNTVPLLYAGEFSATIADTVLDTLRQTGSHAAPFMNPEGIIIYLPDSRTLFKMTFDGNQSKHESITA